jgi:hypothetical protein
MRRVRRPLLACVIAACAALIASSAASAQTFFVNKRNGANTAKCGVFQGGHPGENPCLTIGFAVKRAEASPPPNTLELSAEENPYEETVELTNNKAAGLTIDGEEPGVVIKGKGPALLVHLAGTVTLSNLELAAGTGGVLRSAVATSGAALTLDNVAVLNEASGGENGLEATESGSVTMNGGSVEMENGTIGWAIKAVHAALALNGVTILNGAAAPDPAGGINSEKSSLSASNTHVSVEEGEPSAGIATGTDSAVSLQNVSVRQNGQAIGVVLENSPATVNGLRVEMVRAASSTPAVLSEDAGASSTFSHLEVVGGTWAGIGLVGLGGNLTLSDSRVLTNGSSESPALAYAGEGSSSGLLVQRSVLQAGPSAKPGAVRAEAGNATVDSSEILGGRSGLFFESATSTPHLLTLSASTLDAGVTGIAGDAPGTSGVEAVAKGSSASAANVAIQGSIVLEKQTASAAFGDLANVSCSYSAAPSQSQAAGGGAGAIACVAGVGGNAEVNPLSALLAEPFSAYALNPASSAVDSVPASALTLPAGLAPSPTDVAGNPRVTDGNGDCIAVQDKGALELQGHAAACPIGKKGAPGVGTSSPTVSPAPKPLPAVLTALTISPSSFAAAPKGATISAASKKKYGAKIGYRDSLAATTTFTIVRPSSGRRQGKSCKKPSKRNRHGKRCTLLTKVGRSFTHVDKAGANGLHFSGRISGRKLPPGSYVLQAAPRDAAGVGRVVSRSFTIK